MLRGLVKWRVHCRNLCTGLKRDLADQLLLDYVKSGRVHLLKPVIKQIRDTDVPLSTRTYKSLAMYFGSSRYEHVDSYIESILAEFALPERIHCGDASFALFIAHAGSCGNVKKVQTLLNIAKLNGANGVESYEATVLALIQGGGVRLGLKFLEEATRVLTTFPTPVYIAAATALKDSGDSEKALWLLQQLDEVSASNTSLDVSRLYLLGSLGRVDEEKALKRKLRNEGIMLKSNNSSNSGAMDATEMSVNLSSKKFDQVMNFMRTNDPSRTIWDMVFKAMWTHYQFKYIVELLDLMCNSTISVSRARFEIGIIAARKLSPLHRKRLNYPEIRYYYELKRLGLLKFGSERGDKYMAPVLMSLGEAGRHDEAFTVWKSMGVHGAVVSVARAMILASKDWKEAENILLSMKVRDCGTWNTFLGRLENAGRWLDIEKYYHSDLKDIITTLDSQTISHIVKALSILGKRDLVFSILNESCHHSQPIWPYVSALRTGETQKVLTALKSKRRTPLLGSDWNILLKQSAMISNVVPGVNRSPVHVIWADFISSGNEIDPRLYLSALAAFSKIGDSDMVRDLWSRSESGKHVKHLFWSYMIRIRTDANDWRLYLRLVEQMYIEETKLVSREELVKAASFAFVNYVSSSEMLRNLHESSST